MSPDDLSRQPPTSLPMPPPPPPPPPASEESFDPSQTVFFNRKRPPVRFLPFLVIGLLVLGSGALITWALNQSGKKPADTVQPAEPKNLGDRKVLTPDEARALENPPIQPAQSLPPVEETPAPAVAGTVAATPAPFDPSKPVRPAVAVGGSPADGGAAAAPDAPINLELSNPDNAQVKEEVLRRIDLMPGVSAANKDKLYASVDHARGMGRVLTIPFEKGESVVRAADIERIKQQVQAPAIKKLVDDPTVVFVILGYADQKGNEKINTEVSQSRARSVLEALRDKCGFQNVMHYVAMGGSNLFSAQQVEKNRVAEIWAVLP